MRIWRWLFKRWDRSNCIFGNIAIALFVAVQCFDGIFTFFTVTAGLAVEANPLVNSAMSVIGVGWALTVAKIVAIILGIILYRLATHRWLTLISIVHLVVLVPIWIQHFYG